MVATALIEVQNLLGGKTFPKCDSASLRLEKFVRIGDDPHANSRDPKVKQQEVSAIVDGFNKDVPINHKPIPQLEPRGAVRLVAKLESRLIVNQAGGILQNAGLCLHPHFGSPYIPGSAVKGVARHAAWCEWNEADESQKPTIAKNIAKVFGYPTGDKEGLDAALKGAGEETHSGCIAFLAAVPDGTPRLVVDIVNCHHMKYYEGNLRVASDTESPNPQFFPAVETGCEFVFTLVPGRGAGAEELTLAKMWLIDAITVNGVGAKTAAGYGWFSYDDEAQNAYQRRQDEALKVQKAAAELVELHDRIWSLGKMDGTDPAFAREIKAVEDACRASDGPVKQADLDELHKQKSRLPQLSTKEKLRARWAGLLPIERAVSDCLNNCFPGWTDVERHAAAALFLENDGIGHDLWVAFKDPTKFKKNLRSKVSELTRVIAPLQKELKKGGKK